MIESLRATLVDRGLFRGERPEVKSKVESEARRCGVSIAWLQGVAEVLEDLGSMNLSTQEVMQSLIKTLGKRR